MALCIEPTSLVAIEEGCDILGMGGILTWVDIISLWNSFKFIFYLIYHLCHCDAELHGRVSRIIHSVPCLFPEVRVLINQIYTVFCPIEQLKYICVLSNWTAFRKYENRKMGSENRSIWVQTTWSVGGGWTIGRFWVVVWAMKMTFGCFLWLCWKQNGSWSCYVI